MSKRIAEAATVTADDFASRVLFGAQDDIQRLEEAVKQLSIMKKTLESEGATGAVAELRRQMKPAFQALWGMSQELADYQNALIENEAASAVRTRASRMGYTVSKSRSRTLHTNNRGKFMLCDHLNTVVLGDGFDASIQDIADYLAAKELAR